MRKIALAVAVIGFVALPAGVSWQAAGLASDTPAQTAMTDDRCDESVRCVSIVWATPDRGR